MDAATQAAYRKVDGNTKLVLIALAKCVKKLMVAQGAACENNGIERDAWDLSVAELDATFDFDLF